MFFAKAVRRVVRAKGKWLFMWLLNGKTHQTQSMMEKEMKWSDSDEAINLKLRAFCFDFYLFPSLGSPSHFASSTMNPLWITKNEFHLMLNNIASSCFGGEIFDLTLNQRNQLIPKTREQSGAGHPWKQRRQYSGQLATPAVRFDLSSHVDGEILFIPLLKDAS
jgi:hypothetical protein